MSDCSLEYWINFGKLKDMKNSTRINELDSDPFKKVGSCLGRIMTQIDQKLEMQKFPNLRTFCKLFIHFEKFRGVEF